MMLFPTSGKKSRISSNLSYPVGAGLISAELEHVPQAASLEISFHSKYETMKTRGQAYSIFTVSYGYFETGGWDIIVRPVPRALKQTAKEALVRDFFPSIRQWLQKYAALDSRHGSRWLSVVLDEKGEPLLKLEKDHTCGKVL
jgi:hypothetical protein